MKKRAAAFVLALVLLLLCPACGGPISANAPSPTPDSFRSTPTPEPEPTPEPSPEPPPEELPEPGFHTLRLASETPPRCWNVHNWISSTDALLWSLTVSPLVDTGLVPGEDGEPKDAWLYTMAESVEDVTALWSGAADWGIGPEETGRVWRIRLAKDAVWDDGEHTPILAETYVRSMQLLLSPERQNYRAEAFCSGPAELAGAAAYLRSGSDSWVENAFEGGISFPCSEWLSGSDGLYRTPEGSVLFFSLREPLGIWLDGNSLADYYRAGYVPEETFSALQALADEEGYVPVTDNAMQILYAFTGSDAWGREDREELAYYTVYRRSWPVTGWDSVGLLAEDEHTLLYICAQSTSEFDLLFALTTPWLVHPALYEEESFDYEGRLCTGYGTSPETSVSCGPYRLTELDESHAVLERNESWLGYRTLEEGLYETDRILISFLDRGEALDRFRAGELDLFTGAVELPPAEAQLLWKDDAYTYRFFMVTDRRTLAKLQEAASGDDRRVNKVCLANDAFREGLSYAIDRARLAEAGGESCRPALGLIGDLYRYDVQQDPGSRYRGSLPGMAALCAAYGVSMNGVSDLSGLRGAVEGCTGYDPARARRYFQTAAEQMAAAGDWDSGTVIELNCAVAGEALTEEQLRQEALLQGFLEAAAAGTDLEGRCSIRFVCMGDPYGAVAEGEIEMGFGAWGGAPFDPYGLMQCYCDPSFTTVQERLGFDPERKLLTLLLNNEIFTRTYTEWCRSLLPGGKYASDPELRLQVLAGLEQGLLKERRFIVVAQGASPVWVSEKLIPGSRRYSILTAFGGIRSLRYTRDDLQWSARP